VLRFGIANDQPDQVGPEIQQKRESCGGLRSGIIVRPMNKMWTSGLYELNINAGTSVATLIPVAGTITKRDSDEIAPDGTFLDLWGRTEINWWCKGRGTAGIFRGRESRRV